MGLARLSAEEGGGRVRSLALRRGVFLVWIAVAAPLLPGASGGRRAEANPLLSGIGPEAWIERVQHPDARVRRAALWLLGRHADAWRHSGPLAAIVTMRLQERLRRESDPAVTLAIVYALSQARGPDGDAALRDVFANRSEFSSAVRAAALRAVAAGGERRGVVDVMLNLTWNGTSSMPGDEATEAAVRTLAELPHAEFVDAVRMSQERSTGAAGLLRAVGRRGDPRWAHLLLDALRPSSTGRASGQTLAALDAIARLHLVEAAEGVSALALSEGDLTVRRAATRALGALGGAFDPTVLRGLLAEAPLREAALEAIGALGDRGALPAIGPLLDAPWAGDRGAAARCLGEIRDPAAVSQLAAHARRETDAGVRREMWRALARIGGELARDALRAGDAPLARWALAELLWTDASLRDGSRVEPHDASGELVSALAGAPSDGRGLLAQDPDARVATAFSMGYARVGARLRATQLDLALARESDEGARVAMVQALARIARDSTDPSARGIACDALLGLVAREAGSMTLAGVVALSAVGSLRVAAARGLVARVASSDARDALTRRVALYSAGRLGAMGARLAVERALMVDPDEGVRVAAAFALGPLAGAEADSVLRVASSVASTGALIDRIEAARVAARSGDAAFVGDAVARAGGAPSRSVWALALPDGGLAFGVATGDGELWIEGSSSVDDGDLFRLL